MAAEDVERRAVTISVEVDQDGSAAAWCSVCGELDRTDGGAGDVGAMVRGRTAAHASLHSTALRQGIPWELVQLSLDPRMRAPRRPV